MQTQVKAHAELGASSSARWMACPGSVPLSRPYEKRTSFYAAEGSVAHALAELLLSKGDDATMLAGTVIEHDGHKITVDQDMEDAVQVFIEAVQPVLDGADWFGVEQTVAVRSAPEGAECFGTADAVAITGPELYIGDYKHGKGVQVGVEWNSQVLYYALATYETLLAQEPKLVAGVHRVRMCIVQPRSEGPSVKEWSIDLIDLLMWRDETLLPAIQRIIDGDNTLREGGWCRFCPALAACPEKHARAQEVAKAQFDNTWGGALDNREALSPHEVGTLLAMAKSIADWGRALENEAITLIRQGEEVTGWKLVEGRSNRTWGDEATQVVDTIVRRCKPSFEQAEELLAPAKLRSPAQVEKIVKRWGFPPAKVLESLIVKPPGKPALVTASDPRPALSAARAAEEFEAAPYYEDT